MADLEGLADQGTPLLADLGRAAPNMGRLIRRPGNGLAGGQRELPQPGGRARARASGADQRAASDPRPAPARDARPGRRRRDLDELTASLRADRRHRADQRLPLLPGAQHERLRLDRALPARRAGHQHLLELLHRPRRRGATPISTIRSRPARRPLRSAARNAKFDDVAAAQRRPGASPPLGGLLRGSARRARGPGPGARARGGASSGCAIARARQSPALGARGADARLPARETSNEPRVAPRRRR